jgi:hypothetical protein
MNNENYKFKTVTIHKKEYVMVNERIKYFRLFYPDWSIETKIIDVDKDSIIIQAFIKDDKGCIKSSGTAQEYRNASTINKTSYVENCETSAIGRALGIMGIGIETAIASAEEMKKVQELETKNQYSKVKIDKHIDRVEKKNEKFEKNKKDVEIKVKENETRRLLDNMKTFIYYVRGIENLSTVKLENDKFCTKLIERIGKQHNEKLTDWKDLSSFQVFEWIKRLKNKDHEKRKEMIDRIQQALDELVEEETNKNLEKQSKTLETKERDLI